MLLIRHRAALAIALGTVILTLFHGDAAAQAFTPNGCGTPSTSWVPEYRFTPACNRHDEWGSPVVPMISWTPDPGTPVPAQHIP